MKIKLIILLSVISSVCFAQAIPGYMGYRFTVGYSNYFSPAFLSPTALAYDPPGINGVHCLDIDYSIKPRTNFCFTAQYLRSGVVIKSQYGTGSQQVNYVGNFANPISLQSINIGLGFKFFKHGNLAPLGKYGKVELLILMETVTLDRKDFVRPDYNANTNTAYTGENAFQYKDFALTYTFGRQRVFFNRLVLDYGIRLGFTPPAILAVGDSYSKSGLENELRNASLARLFNEQLINYHIGIGFLAF
jgi:hypothetical protein